MTSARPRGFLMVVDGPQPGRIFPVDKTTLVIGRSRSADVTLRAAGVADHHARILATDHAFELEAIVHAQTLVDGHAVARATLQNGTRVRIGEVELAFLIDRERPTRDLPN